MEDLQHLLGDDYETMDGRPARVVAIMNNATYPVVCVYTTERGDEQCNYLTKDLRIHPSRSPFIRRKPKEETREYWANLYSEEGTPDLRVLAKLVQAVALSSALTNLFNVTDSANQEYIVNLLKQLGVGYTPDGYVNLPDWIKENLNESNT